MQEKNKSPTDTHFLHPSVIFLGWDVQVGGLFNEHRLAGLGRRCLSPQVPFLPPHRAPRPGFQLGVHSTTECRGLRVWVGEARSASTRFSWNTGSLLLGRKDFCLGTRRPWCGESQAEPQRALKALPISQGPQSPQLVKPLQRRPKQTTLTVLSPNH